MVRPSRVIKPADCVPHSAGAGFKLAPAIGEIPVNRVVKRLFILILVGAVGGLALFFFSSGRSESSAAFRSETVTRSDLQMTISATGTVEPEELVDVGAQVAGRIVAFGKDASGKAIDYGSAVDEGMVLAQIDDALFEAEAAQSEAQVGVAKAGLVRAEADLGQLQAKLLQAERDWSRARKLGPSDALSQSAYDAAESAYEVAKSNVAVGKAAIVQARSSVSQAEAALKKARQNLEYCIIKSPVKGIIIARRVNIGQTVVASLNAPSLFLIAKDLRRLQIWVAVNEADIGSIQPGQPVDFTVDAFPGGIFAGTVGKILLNAQMTQNVVTYTVEVNTDNSNSKLLPYLTANVKFIVKESRDALTVPNAALRWNPRPELIAAGENRGQPSPPGKSPRKGDEEPARGTVWVEQSGLVRPVSVQIGLSDGSRTEVRSDELKEGMEIVTGEQVKEAREAPSVTNPFTPKLPGPGRGGR